VAEYERRDAQATVEVQRAARLVVDQNRQLRALLLERGVLQHEIEASLARISSASQSSPDDGKGLDKVAGCQTSGQSKSDATEPPGDYNTTTTADPKHDDAQGRKMIGALDALESSCDDAAEIIAQYQGHADINSARKALGCKDATPCYVRNVRVFQAMDEAS
jgi:hypothetical protein